MLSKEEIENIETLNLKNKTKEAIKKSKEIIHNDKNNQCECSKEVSLAYDMQYVERYVEYLETDKQKLIEYIEKKIGEYDETIIELVLQNVLAVAKGEKNEFPKMYEYGVKVREDDYAIEIEILKGEKE